jgi:hypothetical protein
MTLRILTDFHHHALAESLLALFEDRMGGEVWFPTGMDWFNRWYWSFERAFHGDAVARQYLEGVWAGAQEIGGGVVIRDDPRYPGRNQRGISLDAALAERWDLVICSLPHNYDGFHRLARETGARYGIQIGNAVQQWDERADFALSSSTLPGRGPEWAGRQFVHQGVPTVMYHQEFSLEMFRHEWPPADRRTVASFVNCFAEQPEAYADFARLAAAHADEFDWKVYGSYGSVPVDELAAGDISDVPAVADEMRRARIGWHSKAWSDGFGHVVHNWFSIGRPVIGWARYYADKLAAPLWVEGETSFDIARHSVDELVGILRRLRDDDDYHQRISEAAAARFRDVVDFGAEADAIAELLGVAVPA